MHFNIWPVTCDLWIYGHWFMISFNWFVTCGHWFVIIKLILTNEHWFDLWTLICDLSTLTYDLFIVTFEFVNKLRVTITTSYTQPSSPHVDIDLQLLDFTSTLDLPSLPRTYHHHLNKYTSLTRYQQQIWEKLHHNACSGVVQSQSQLHHHHNVWLMLQAVALWVQSFGTHTSWLWAPSPFERAKCKGWMSFGNYVRGAWREEKRDR